MKITAWLAAAQDGLRGPCRSSRPRRGAGVAALLCALGVLALAPGAAQAAFTRPFVRELKGTCPDNGGTYETQESGKCKPSGEPVTRFAPTGVEVSGEAGDLGDLLVESGGALDRFAPAPADGFIARESGVLPSYKQAEACPLGKECTRYESVDTFLHEAVVAFTAKLEPKPFTASEPYIGGEHHNEITGIPAGAHECAGAEFKHTPGGPPAPPEAVTVDPAGDLYVAVPTCHEVLEFLPSGEYKQDFVPQPVVPGEIPGAEGLAFDLKSRHLLVASGMSAVENHERLVGSVQEFDVEGPGAGEFVAGLSETPAGGLVDPVEVAVDSEGYVYVLDSSREVVDVWGPGAYAPTVMLGVASERRPSEAVLHGTVAPEQQGNVPPAPVVECYFQYLPEEAYDRAREKGEEEGFAGAARATCEPARIETGLEETHPVEAKLAGLVSGTTYRYRLVAATEEAKRGGVTRGREALAFTAPAAPDVIAGSATDVSSGFAELHAQIDPRGAQTSYYFEYGPTTAYGQRTPVASVGSGGPDGDALERVAQPIGGLQPDSTYYFRVVAENEVGAREATGMFATQPAAASSGRGYELVTPASREGGSDMFAEPLSGGSEVVNRSDGVPSESGEAFFLETHSPFGSFPFAFEQAYVFRREAGTGRWSSASLACSPTCAEESGLSALGVQSNNDEAGALESQAFSRVAFSDLVGTEREDVRSVVLLGPAGGPYQDVREDAPVLGDADNGADTEVAGASGSLGKVVLESRVVSKGLEEEEGEPCSGAAAITHGHALCEWVGGQSRLVDAKPGSETEPVSVCGATLGANGGVGNLRRGSAFGAVSAGGTSVFFTAPDPEASNTEGKEEGCWNAKGFAHPGEATRNAPQLYARVESRDAGGEAVHRTLEVSAPEEGVTENDEGKRAPTRHYAEYVGASQNGSRVFFATETQLTREAAQLRLHDLELYECQIVEEENSEGEEVSRCELTRVSAGEGAGRSAEGVNMLLALAGEAGEGFVAYFTANGVLADNENSKGEHARPGDCEVNKPIPGLECGLYRYQSAVAGAPARTTFIAMVNAGTFGNVTEGGYLVPDPRWTKAYATPNGRFLLFNDDSGIYRYDALSGSLAFIANGEFARSARFGPLAGPVRAMSDNGEYVFFDTIEQLVPQAHNQEGPEPVLDTYQWHAGRFSLVGSSTGTAPTFFLGYAPNPQAQSEEAREGGSVFIGTHAQLTSQSTNGVGSIYDARVCEEHSPCIAPPSGETAQCEGSSCEHPPAAAVFQTPSTLTAQGSGNVPAAGEPPTVVKKCKRGFVRRKVKKREECVRVKKAKRAKRAGAKRAGRGRGR